MQFDILNRWTRAVLFSAEIDCADSAGSHTKMGRAVRMAVALNADIKGANLIGAYLEGAPVIPSIHQTIYAAASAPEALDMKNWHSSCGTAHCRAGWAVALAGAAGKKFEDKLGDTAAAAYAIYWASDPSLKNAPDFYCSNSEALADMKRLADEEAAKQRA